MKAFHITFMLVLFTTACSKNQTSPEKEEEEEVNKNKSAILGTWHNLNWLDSVYRLDGTFIGEYLYVMDTSFWSLETTNFMTFNDDGTYYSQVPQPYPSDHLTTFYDFISKDQYSETRYDIFTGQRDATPYDTVTIKTLTDTTMILEKITIKDGFYDSAWTKVREHSIQSWFR